VAEPTSKVSDGESGERVRFCWEAWFDRGEPRGKRKADVRTRKKEGRWEDAGQERVHWGTRRLRKGSLGEGCGRW